MRLQSVETWFDPMEMFRQIAPTGNITRSVYTPKPGEDISTALHGDDTATERAEAEDGAVITDEMSGMTLAACPFISGQ